MVRTTTDDVVQLIPPIDWKARHRLGPDPEGRAVRVGRLWQQFCEQHQITQAEADALLLQRRSAV